MQREQKSSVTAVQSSKRQSETGKPVAATGLCHLELPVLITYCVKLQSFECPDLLCFSCSRECAWHWVAELQSPSFSTMSPQVIVLPLLLCPLCWSWPVLENVHEGGHPRSWNWKEDWAQHWPGVSLDELGNSRSWDRKQGWKGRAVMIPNQYCAWSHFQSCDPLWPASSRMVCVKSLRACPDDQRRQLSPAAALVVDRYGLPDGFHQSLSRTCLRVVTIHGFMLFSRNFQGGQ